MKAMFLKAVHAKAGVVVQWVVGGVTGWAFAWLANHGLTLPEDIQQQVVQAGVAAGAFLVSTAVQTYQNTQAKAMQEAVGIHPDDRDGWIGQETLKQAGRLVEELRKRIGK